MSDTATIQCDKGSERCRQIMELENRLEILAPHKRSRVVKRDPRIEDAVRELKRLDASPPGVVSKK